MEYQVYPAQMVKTKKYIIGAYFIAGVLFLSEYIYYKVTTSLDIMHYSNILLYIYGSPLTEYSGLHIIAIIIVLLMPVVIFILKKKTILNTIIFIVIFLLHLFAGMVLVSVLDTSFNSIYCFNKYKQPGGEIVICSQIEEDFYKDIVTVYVETGFNTLKKARKTAVSRNMPRELKQEIIWENNSVCIIIYKKNIKNIKKIRKRARITYNKIQEIIKN